MEYGVLGTDVKLQTTRKKSQIHDFKMFTSLYPSLGRGEEKRGGFSFGLHFLNYRYICMMMYLHTKNVKGWN
jgi:hypothetical protein